MSKAFVRQLPRVPSGKLPADANCPICIQPYENQTTDSGSFEKPVCLPCDNNHVFGSECLSEWLRIGTSCPLCRHELVVPKEDSRMWKGNAATYSLLSNLKKSQDWDDFWYATFWILQLHGDKAIGLKWQRWQQEWIAAAEQWDDGSQARAKAALASSPLMPRTFSNDDHQVRVTAAGIQTLRFREYCLYLRFQADAAERPELRAPPGFQLTPDQENALFRELERREVFTVMARFTAISRREQWNILRDVGLVWNPDIEVFWRSRRGRWSRYHY